MWCNYFVDQFRRRKLEGKRGSLRLQGSPERETMIFFGQKRFQWMASFVGNGRPVQATRVKADFCNLRERQKQGWLIWSKMRELPPAPPPPPHLLGSIKTQFGLLVKCTIIRDPETILGSLFHSERPSLRFAIKTTKQRLKTCSYASLMKWKGKIEKWS